MRLHNKILLSIPFCCMMMLSNHILSKETNKENLFSIDAQIRARAEFRHGTFQPLPIHAKPAGLISQRTRFSLAYQYKDLLKLKISPQMVSIWGQESMTQGVSNNNGLSFFEAYAQININPKASFLIGRQVISLDDERFFGALDWAQGGRAHDAVAFQLKKGKGEFRAYFAFNQNYKELYRNNLSNVSGSLFSPKGAINYKWMQTAWGKYMIDKNNSISAIVANVGFQNATHALDTAKTFFSPTIGVNYSHNKNDWKVNTSVYYQTGKNAQGISTNAYLLSASFNKKLNPMWNIGLGADIVSGNNINENANKYNNAFIPYFGTNHKFYGSMDYYYAGNTHSNTGLGDIYLSTSFEPKSKLKLTAVFHQFLTPNKVNNGFKRLSTNTGQEIDFNIVYSINKFTKLVGGYSIYTVSETTKYLKNAADTRNTQHWVWLSLNIQPNLLNFNY